MQQEPSKNDVSRYVMRVRFGDTDLMGIVHHAVYLSFLEAGRVEFMHRRGLSYRDCVERGVHLPVVEVAIRYRKPLVFDDRVIIETQVVELTRATVRFAYRLFREGPEEVLVAEASTMLACVGDDRVPRRLPEAISTALLGPEVKPRPVDQA